MCGGSRVVAHLCVSKYCGDRGFHSPFYAKVADPVFTLLPRKLECEPPPPSPHLPPPTACREPPPPPLRIVSRGLLPVLGVRVVMCDISRNATQFQDFCGRSSFAVTLYVRESAHVPQRTSFEHRCRRKSAPEFVFTNTQTPSSSLAATTTEHALRGARTLLPLPAR